VINAQKSLHMTKILGHM